MPCGGTSSMSMMRTSPAMEIGTHVAVQAVVAKGLKLFLKNEPLTMNPGACLIESTVGTLVGTFGTPYLEQAIPQLQFEEDEQAKRHILKGTINGAGFSFASRYVEPGRPALEQAFIGFVSDNVAEWGMNKWM